MYLLSVVNQQKQCFQNSVNHFLYLLEERFLPREHINVIRLFIRNKHWIYLYDREI